MLKTNYTTCGMICFIQYSFSLLVIFKTSNYTKYFLVNIKTNVFRFYLLLTYNLRRCMHHQYLLKTGFSTLFDLEKGAH